MKNADVSFTFLHRVEEIEWNVADGRWQSALALALTLPDICGGIAFPEIVKRHRDGRVKLDRQKNPTRDVGNQYIRWFDAYAAIFFKLSPEDAVPYISGERCWQLRCEYLHQNKGFLNEEDEDTVRFHLGVNCGSSICRMEQEQSSKENEIRIDIEQFCLRMCMAARSYYDAAQQKEDFSLYHTPVLDFIQASRGDRTNPLLVILCGTETYGKGLRLAVEQLSNQILVCTTAKDARQQLGKKKPALWIITEDCLEETDQPWKNGSNRPVIVLTKTNTARISMEKRDGRLTLLQMPIEPKALRSAVMAQL